MTTLVAGASGATGRQLVEQLLSMDQKVKIIVRLSSIVPDNWSHSDKIQIIRANISDIQVDEMSEYIKDCQAFASCLGHNLTLKGIYGHPRKLVTDTVQLVYNAIKKNSPEKPIKYVLMNTVGNSNRDLKERISFGEKIVIGALRLMLPPHVDNEKAADYLRTKVGQNNPSMEWVAVRPDSLIDEDKVTEYELFASPVRSGIFNPGKTSRINVGHFMARLITDDSLWNEWKGRMPVIYNREPAE